VIVTFTPNPAVDKTLAVPGLAVGSVNRAAESHLDPGGKGINASRIVHRLGRQTTALTVLGGHIGRLLRGGLDAEGVPCRAVWVPEETRLNVVLHDATANASTRVWDRGAEVPAGLRDAVLELALHALPQATVFLCAGTLPPGMPPDTYARVLDAAAEHGVRTVLDSDGEAFRRGLDGRPTLIKPNVREAEALLGRRLATEADVIDGATELLRRGPEAVVVSRGAEGSILVTAERVLRATPPRVERRSAVGSGDSLVAGFLVALAEGSSLEEGLRLGTAAGAATAMSVGTQLGSAEDIAALVPQVRIDVL
jgi:1-phosphofructokinase